MQSMNIHHLEKKSGRPSFRSNLSHSQASFFNMQGCPICLFWLLRRHMTQYNEWSPGLHVTCETKSDGWFLLQEK